eukprot:CAMPEP_0183712858 /NCGR_PEP_ID=MMETSP0737-20130205/7913_1 /TAXON_ID=385413 /ORGANISM="Thalassiosira miniscula, Strain CCMP1093" /LENGTH=378 /DNA_ID=CAMNT_0025941577 /DNA_START=170 /DNA_END=1303 /DNA_ORIENTATION=+
MARATTIKNLGGGPTWTIRRLLPVIGITIIFFGGYVNNKKNIRVGFPFSAESTAISSRNHSVAVPASNSIDVVSLTIRVDFYILFNNTAMNSWIRHIQNIRSITFIGPPEDYTLFQQNMKIFYPHLLSTNNNIPIRWVNQTHWKETYMENSQFPVPCPYWKVCQQLIKMHVFDIRTHLGLDLLDNVLIVDSDTVWARDVSFVNGTNGRATYFEIEEEDPSCRGLDPIKFTEAMTAGPLGNDQENNNTAAKTLTPFKACRRPEYTNSSGLRHIGHHMLFQYDIMNDLHNAAMKAWNATNFWDAANVCFQHDYCNGRVAEYELYFSFVSENYPHRVNLETIEDGVDIMLFSAICDEKEMACCREKSVLLKGCHDHRIASW